MGGGEGGGPLGPRNSRPRARCGLLLVHGSKPGTLRGSRPTRSGSVCTRGPHVHHYLRDHCPPSSLFSNITPEPSHQPNFMSSGWSTHTPDHDRLYPELPLRAQKPLQGTSQIRAEMHGKGRSVDAHRPFGVESGRGRNPTLRVCPFDDVGDGVLADAEVAGDPNGSSSRRRWH